MSGFIWGASICASAVSCMSAVDYLIMNEKTRSDFARMSDTQDKVGKVVQKALQAFALAAVVATAVASIGVPFIAETFADSSMLYGLLGGSFAVFHVFSGLYPTSKKASDHLL